MKIRPLQDRILVKRLEAEVIAVGAGKLDDKGHLRAPDVKVGDKILFGKYSGTEVKIDEVEHLIIREEDILGVIER